jgi:hypothetical protein
MTPKEKAEELVEKFTLFLGTDNSGNEYYVEELDAKRGVLISVDDTVEALEHNAWQNKDYIDYYKEVKQEINKL